jgi:hypothetical protein
VGRWGDWGGGRRLGGGERRAADVGASTGRSVSVTWSRQHRSPPAPLPRAACK